MVRLSSLLGIIFLLSCKTSLNSCPSNSSGEISALIDTNFIYVLIKVEDLSDPNSLFAKYETDLVKKISPALKFSKKKCYYFNQTDTYLGVSNPTIGYFKVFLDSVQICREHYSVQRGRFYKTSTFLVRDSFLIEKSFIKKSNIISIYKKTSIAINFPKINY